MTNQTKNYIFLAGVAIAALALLSYRGGKEAVVGNNLQPLTPVESITHEFSGNHLHGLGYDSRNQRIFLATHYGLFIWQEGQLFQLGDTRDDFMGFVLHPHDPDIMYTSGHPKMGGNLGVMKSEDGGQTFTQVYSGPDGINVDFHSMAISSADPDTLYGWFQENVYRTRDGGNGWEKSIPEGMSARGLCWGVPCLGVHSENPDKLYAGSFEGLYVSEDGGTEWRLLTDQLGSIGGVGIDPNDSDRIFAFSMEQGVMASIDGGGSWEARHSGISLHDQEIVFAFAFDEADANQVFLTTTQGQLYHSGDGGESWQSML